MAHCVRHADESFFSCAFEILVEADRTALIVLAWQANMLRVFKVSTEANEVTGKGVDALTYEDTRPIDRDPCSGGWVGVVRRTS